MVTKEEALAQYLKCSVDDIHVESDENDYEVYTYVPVDSESNLDEKSYYVFTSKEAKDFAKGHIEDDILGDGLSLFEDYIQDWILENAVDYSEIDEHYVDDVLKPSINELDEEDLLDAAIYTYNILENSDVYEDDEDELPQVKESIDLDEVRKDVLAAAKQELEDKITTKNNEEYKEYVLDYIYWNPGVVDSESVAEELITRKGVEPFIGTEIDLEDSVYYAYKINK